MSQYTLRWETIRNVVGSIILSFIPCGDALAEVYQAGSVSAANVAFCVADVTAMVASGGASLVAKGAIKGGIKASAKAALSAAKNAAKQAVLRMRAKLAQYGANLSQSLRGMFRKIASVRIWRKNADEFVENGPRVRSIYSDGTRVLDGQQPPRLPRTPDPSANGPHSLIRHDAVNDRIYQLREFDANGNLVRDVDMTNPTFPNGTPRPNHPGPPHQHRFSINDPNVGPASGFKRGAPEAIE